MAARFSGIHQDAPDIVLRRLGPGRFRLLEQFRYQDPKLGSITVPRDVTTFETDLASIPWFSAWYVPQFGPHTAAVILHDALISDPANPTYESRDGHTITPDEADRIFLEAMTTLGTPRLTRLMMWSVQRLVNAAGPRYWRAAVWYTLVVVLSVFLALDVVDLCFTVSPLNGLDSCWTARWTGDHGFFVEWLVAAGILSGVMTVVGPILYGPGQAKATTVQAVVAGLTFLPTLLMLPARLLLVILPDRVPGA